MRFSDYAHALILSTCNPLFRLKENPYFLHQKTLIDSEFVQKLEPIVQKLLDGIKSAPLLQLKLKPSEIENLTNQINEIIPIKLLTDYKEIVNKYTFTFSKKAFISFSFRKTNTCFSFFQVSNFFKLDFRLVKL